MNIAADWVPPETVRMMADVLSQLDPEEASRRYEALIDYGRCTPNELSDLIVFFKICAEHTLGLVGSY